MKRKSGKLRFKLAGILLVPLLCALLLALASAGREPISIAFAGYTNRHGKTCALFQITNHTSRAFDLTFRPQALDSEGTFLETFSSVHESYFPIYDDTIKANGVVESLWSNPMSADKWHLLVRYRPGPSRYEDAKRSIYYFLENNGFKNLATLFDNERQIYSQVLTNAAPRSQQQGPGR